MANATPIRDALIAEDGFAPEKLRVIHNGVDIEKFHTGQDGRDHLFPGVGDAKLVVLVGNMHSDVKGHPWLIASAPAVIREFPSTRFVLVGDGEQRAGFEQQVARLGLEQTFYSSVAALIFRRFSPAVISLCFLPGLKVYRMQCWNTWPRDCQPS